MNNNIILSKELIYNLESKTNYPTCKTLDTAPRSYSR